MRSIRSNIIIAFLIVIASSLLVITAVVVISFNLLNQYKKINDNVVYEQKLKENIWLLIEESYQGFNSNDYSKYDQTLKDIKETEKILDVNFLDTGTSQETKLAYRSTKNSFNLVINSIEGIKKHSSEKGSITGISDVFQASVQNFEFVKQNVSDLLLSETKNLAAITQNLKSNQNTIIILLVLTILLLVSFLLIFSFVFSGKITDPIVELSDIAKRVSGGNLTIEVKKSLLERGDEIGSLAKSFNLMIGKLRDKIVDFEISNRELDIKLKEINNNNSELEKNKLVIMNLLEDFHSEKINSDNLVIERTKELSDEKARLLASIDSLTIGFAIVDMNGNVVVNNPSILLMLDLERGSFSLDDISSSIKIEGLGLLERLKDSAKDNSIVDIKEVMIHSKYFRMLITPVFSTDNIFLGGVIIIDDITEQKVLERSRDEFFAVASHELRTPLTAIRGNSEMILDGYKEKIQDKDVLEMISDIDEASIRLITIVNDFLEVSRLEQGKMSFNRTNFDIIEIVEKIVKTLSLEASKKNLTLNINKPESSLPKVFADREKVEQILLNLMGNSIKFTDKGSITVSFELKAGSLETRVSDTGKGISPENESLLFRKFQPAGSDALARDVTKSTGLGLYISKIITEKMEGTIGLEKSEAGVGSTFYFTLPIAS